MRKFSECLSRQEYPQGKYTLKKTEALTKSMNMYIWGIGTLNQLFVRCTYTQIFKNMK